MNRATSATENFNHLCDVIGAMPDRLAAPTLRGIAIGGIFTYRRSDTPRLILTQNIAWRARPRISWPIEQRRYKCNLLFFLNTIKTF